MMLTARFEEALVLAVRLHAGQTRKGTDTPYISHLLGVTGIVLEHGASEDEAIAALLHDAAEDQGGGRHLGEDPGPLWRDGRRNRGGMYRLLDDP